MESGIDISAALKFIKEGRKPITADEANKFVGRKVASIMGIYGGDVEMYEGTLEKVGTTFHQRALDYLHFKGRETWYEKKLFGWKRRNYVTNVGVTGEINVPERGIGSVINVEVLFSDGVYYPVHVGTMEDHRKFGRPWECECCIANMVNDWTKHHKQGAEGFKFMDSGEERLMRKVLKKYPKEFEAHFGKETVEGVKKLLEEHY